MSAQDDVDVKQLSMTGRNALWQKLMPARAGSAQDAAERMKTLKPPDPKRPEDHKHALLYLQNHAGADRELDGVAPKGADRKKALSWLKAAMSKISDGEKSYQLPVKWLIGNWRLWPDPDRKDEEGFQDLKALAVKKLDGIGIKYEKQYVENNIGQELGFIGEDLEIKVRPRQDEHIVMPEDRLGLEEQDEEEDDYRMSEAAYIVLLLSAVHAVDHLFQDRAKEICESVGGSVRAPPPKGFMRMWAKLDTDHAKAKSPKAAENIDTNRVAWIFQEPKQLRDAFAKAQEVFGPPVRIKNGYDPSFDALSDTKGYRNILANYRFIPGLTWGDLAGRSPEHAEASKKTNTAWDKFRPKPQGNPRSPHTHSGFCLYCPFSSFLCCFLCSCWADCGTGESLLAGALRGVLLVQKLLVETGGVQMLRSVQALGIKTCPVGHPRSEVLVCMQPRGW